MVKAGCEKNTHAHTHTQQSVVKRVRAMRELFAYRMTKASEWLRGRNRFTPISCMDSVTSSMKMTKWSVLIIIEHEMDMIAIHKHTLQSFPFVFSDFWSASFPLNEIQLAHGHWPYRQTVGLLTHILQSKDRTSSLHSAFHLETIGVVVDVVVNLTFATAAMPKRDRQCAAYIDVARIKPCATSDTQQYH